MPVFKRSFFILLFLAAAALAVTVYNLPGAPAAKPLDEAVAPADTVVVQVAGAVRQPGVVRLTATDRVEQAIAACGGALPTADLDRVNLAQTVQDGSRIQVPEKAPAAPPPAASTPATTPVPAGMTAAPAATERIHLNTADEKALETLPGIGPVMAKRIVEYRTKHGAFQHPEDLKRVRGIGERTYEKLKDRVEL
ncbi:MAG: ComEA family DNA-binding protein [Schwartzia sp.]|nr:ComEA family DNA-binding protein [Schwartzia sp. (in: firmicutes)]